MSAPKTFIQRYDKVIDIDVMDNVMPIHLIEQLYENTVRCFPDSNIKSAKNYYIRLVNYLHNNLRLVTRKTPSPSLDIFEAPEYGLLYQVLDDDDGNDRWEMFVLYEGSPAQLKVAASCLVHIENQRAEIEEVCVGIPGKKYCKTMISKVIDELRKEPGVQQIIVYCENDNIPACKCYDSVFTNRAPGIKHGVPITNFTYTLQQKRSLSRSATKTKKMMKTKM